MTPLVLIVFGISGWAYALIILGLWSLAEKEWERERARLRAELYVRGGA